MKLLLLALAGCAAALAQNTSCPNATGQAPHCVVLAFTPPTTGPTPTGYNFYMATATGQCTPVTAATCTKVTQAPAGGTTFTVNSSASLTLKEGQTYFFVATSVNGTAESGPSGEASATIPFLVPAPPTITSATAH